MKHKFSFWAVLGAVLLCSANVFALTCKNDYSTASGCASNANAAGDCTTLGYETADVSGCSHYIYCPFDTSYKRCTSITETTCATGTYKTKAECITANPGLVKCILNSDGCYKPIFGLKICADGTYDTQEECEKGSDGLGLSRRICTKDSFGCWAPITNPANCSSLYTLTECPENGVCDDCTTSNGTKKYFLTGCNTNYYLGTDKCVSCATAKAEKEKLKKIATVSLLNCCSDTFSLCRSTSNCDGSNNYGSWDDGCLLAYIAMIDAQYERDNKTAIFKATQKACEKTIQNVVVEIESFNEKCPNHTVKASDIVPEQLCRDVSDNGQKASAVEDYGDRGVGCFDNSTIYQNTSPVIAKSRGCFFAQLMHSADS